MSVPRVSVVIPAMNEARNLPSVLPRLPADVYELILVDGRSTDGTADVARAIRPDVRIVHQPGRGKGDALRAGFAAATGDIIVALDADGSNDPGEIPRFVAALMAGADFVKGSRFMGGGGTTDMPFHRKLGNATFVQLVRILFRCRYTDLCYGYNAFWRRILPVLELDGDGFEIETEMNVRVLRAGLRVSEVPSFEAERIYGESNLQAIPDGLRVLRTILHERFKPTSEAMRVARRVPDTSRGGWAISGGPHLEPIPMAVAASGVREAPADYVAVTAAPTEEIDLPAVLQIAARLRLVRDRSRSVVVVADAECTDSAERMVAGLRQLGGHSAFRVIGPGKPADHLEARAEPGDVLLIFAVDGRDETLVDMARRARHRLLDAMAVIEVEGGPLAREVNHLVLATGVPGVPGTIAGLHAVICDIVLTALAHESVPADLASIGPATVFGSSEPAV